MWQQRLPVCTCMEASWQLTGAAESFGCESFIGIGRAADELRAAGSVWLV